jgi:hypothetical protein
MPQIPLKSQKARPLSLKWRIPAFPHPESISSSLSFIGPGWPLDHYSILPGSQEGA